MARVCMVVFNEYMFDSRVRREAEALVEKGYSVDCICLSADRLKQVCGVRLFAMSSKRYRGINPLRLVLGYIQFFCYAFFTVTVLHLHERYDIVQAHTMPDFLIFTGLIPKLLGAKLVLDIHDLMPELYVAKFGSSHRKWMVRLITWIERRSVAFADRTIAVHKPHLDILEAHGNPRDKFSILLNTPDHRIFARQPSPDRSATAFRLIYHGTISKRAGLETAVRAVARARTEIPHIRFHIIGGGDGCGVLAALIEELQLTDCVEVSPSVRVELLPALFAQADVGIMPYEADAFTQYILPTKLMEYAACGVPSVVSRLRTVEAYFDADMVAYCEPGNDAELADQIVRLYRNPEQAALLASNASRFTENYNWPQQREIYYRLVDSLLPEEQLLVNAD